MGQALRSKAIQVEIDVASLQLEKLIEAAQAGQEVIIADGATPVERIAAVERSKFKFGVLEGVLTEEIPDFLEPMSEEDLALWEGRG